MPHFFGTILLILFLFQSPILFYINSKYKRRINIFLLGFLSFLLGWILCYPLCLIRLYPTHELSLFFTLMLGWLISGVLLLLWSPVITFFLVKSKKVKLLMGLITCTLILYITHVHYNYRYDWGVPGNRFLYKASCPSGLLDHSYISVFEAENDLLKNKMIKKWKLQSMQIYPGRNEPISFVAIKNKKPEWWPTKDILEKLEGYSHVDESEERYHSLWYDPNSQRLYLEHGNW